MKKTLLSVCLLALCVISLPVRAQIIAEAFRNIDCANCRTPDDGYENFIRSQHPEYNVTIVYIHNDFPSPVDPFYTLAKSDVDVRTNMYNILSDPTMFINGKYGQGSLTPWKNLTTSEASQPAPTATLGISSSSNGDGTYNVKIDVVGSIAGTTVKLYAMVVESEIKYYNEASYGNFPDSSWNNVFRKMLPDADGSDAFSVNGNMSFTYTLDPKPQNLNPANLKIVAFLQDTKSSGNNSYPIKASAVAPLATAGVQNTALSSAFVGQPSVNPFSANTSIPVHLQTPSHVTAVVYNSLGAAVSTIVDKTITESDATLTFFPGSLAAGMYRVAVSIDGKLVASRAIVYQP